MAIPYRGNVSVEDILKGVKRYPNSRSSTKSRSADAARYAAKAEHERKQRSNKASSKRKQAEADAHKRKKRNAASTGRYQGKADKRAAEKAERERRARANAAASARLSGQAQKFLSQLQQQANQLPKASALVANQKGGSTGGSYSGSGGGGGGSTSGGGAGGLGMAFGTPVFSDVNPRSTNQDRQSALDRVYLEMGGKERELKRALEMIQENSRYNTDVQTNYAKFGDARLAEIGRQLAETLGGNTERVQNLWGETQNNIGDYYARTSRDVDDLGQQASADIQQSANTLGLSDSLADDVVSRQLADQLRNIQEQSATSRAGAQSRAANLGGTFGSSAIQAESDAAREIAGNRTGLLRQVQSSIADIGRTGSSQQFDVLGQLSDLASKRGAAQRVALEDVTQARIDRQRQQRLDELASMLQQGALSLQQQQLGLQRDESLFNRDLANRQFGLQQQQLELQKRQLEAQLNQAANPYEEAMLRLELQKIQSQIDLNNSRTQKNLNPSPKDKKYRGMSGVQQWVKDTGTPGHYTDMFNDLLQYSRGSIPVTQLGNYASQLAGVGTSMNEAQGFGRLVNVIVPKKLRPTYHRMYQIYSGKY